MPASASFGAGFELVRHTTDDSVHSSAVRRGSDWFFKRWQWCQNFSKLFVEGFEDNLTNLNLKQY